ncbi:sugar lactone lactonase YvrE [Amaricoccus macauensis]|uniref:Sugar lactone lactonase YvrE n=1 Tax=Amaricoccus macauensis TaxID=57001 RepID=A0A840SJB0_9RHOB|nr:SMP-30/gluconolactonase/LRE family protein [Amaricoccus macauensis]MBB5221987.1 sugar lactone lactonase YvrE [Amaricoccus macauensis]
MELDCVAPVGDITGEGAVWSAAECCIYWTDINRFLVHRLAVSDRSVRTWFFDEPAVAVALTDQPGVLLVALATRLVLWTPADDERRTIATLPASDAVRFNDARPCPRGTLIIGTMGNNVGPDGEAGNVTPGLGALYRFAGDHLDAGAFETLETGIGIANTVAWSPDAAIFYFADTLANEIRTCEHHPETGALGTPSAFFAGFERGAPDGSAIDSAGYLWNCRYGGGCVVRIAPDGSIERIIEVPCGNVTTCTFGGTDLRTLFITTARGGSGRSERLAGSLFALEAPAPGVPERAFRLG